MNTLTISRVSAFLLLWIAISKEGDCAKAGNESDDEFAYFLKKSMDNYTDWLKENKLDPSPVVQNVVKTGAFDSLRVKLDCKLINHYAIGHSSVQDYSLTGSKFANYNYQMGRETFGIFESHGDFECTGRIIASFYPELSKNLPFSGQGKFIIAINHSIEYIIMYNVGVTQDYKLNLTHAWPVYDSDVTQKWIRLTGTWNDTRINDDYFEDVEAAFSTLYSNYPFFYDDTPSYPTAQLLEKYVLEVAQNVDLTEILGTEYLPEPFDPLPTTTTTTPTTTSEKDNAGERVFIQAGVLILLQTILVICSIWFSCD